MWGRVVSTALRRQIFHIGLIKIQLLLKLHVCQTDWKQAEVLQMHWGFWKAVWSFSGNSWSWIHNNFAHQTLAHLKRSVSRETRIQRRLRRSLVCSILSHKARQMLRPRRGIHEDEGPFLIGTSSTSGDGGRCMNWLHSDQTVKSLHLQVKYGNVHSNDTNQDIYSEWERWAAALSRHSLTADNNMEPQVKKEQPLMRTHSCRHLDGYYASLVYCCFV